MEPELSFPEAISERSHETENTYNYRTSKEELQSKFWGTNTYETNILLQSLPTSILYETQLKSSNFFGNNQGSSISVTPKNQFQNPHPTPLAGDSTPPKPAKKSTFDGMMKILEGVDKNLIDLDRNPICFMQVWHKNDHTYYRGCTVEGSFHGLGEIFHTNGQLRYRGDFRYGGPHGKTCTVYHSNGRICYMGRMIDGEMTGAGILYDMSGRVKTEGSYLMGKLDGKDCRVYFSNGVKMFEGGVVSGVWSGSGVEYWPNGQVKLEGGWIDGKMETNVGVEYYENGNVKYKGKFSDGVYIGEGVLYHPVKDKVCYEGKFSNGGPWGVNCGVFYASGKINYRGECSAKGLWDGHGRKYDQNGILRYKGSWVGSRKEGPEGCRQFDNKGKLIYEGGYKADLYEGYGVKYLDEKVLYRGAKASTRESLVNCFMLPITARS
jgi:antitoxin component YwqK of YwqJK toxin-antitoxin module